jgi:hypothetical protein
MEGAMRCESRVGLFLLAFVALSAARPAGAAGPPARKLLDARQREAVLRLIKAVDTAQETDVASDEALAWDGHILKSGDQTAYVPFRLTYKGAAEGFTSAVIYVRAVTRRDGMRASEEHSFLRDWLVRGNDVPSRMGETIYVGPGEMPVGGPAAGSGRRSIAAPAEALAVLALQQRAFDKQKAAAAEAKKQAETKARDPFRFAFEDYYLADTKSARDAGARVYERAMTLPPGEYDIFVGLLDRAHAKTSSPAILKRTLVVPDFWDDRLAVSSLILAKAVTPLKGPLPAAQQVEHPYTLGQTEVVPVVTPSFSPDEALSVVFQVSNYGAPDADLTIDYAFFRTDGPRRLFNRTDAQQLSDDDLPPPGAWDTQAFAMQTVPLRSFPPGRYELEVIVKDRLTRATATGTVAFSVASEVR